MLDDPAIDSPNLAPRLNIACSPLWQAFPALAELRLELEDLRFLERQGFVAVEDRDGRQLFKLRFRRGNTQIVRCIANEEAARRVRIEVERLQHNRRAELNVTRAARQAAAAVRASKATLAVLLEAHGFYFHGLAIRRRLKSSV